jgi:hypothetical protein
MDYKERIKYFKSELNLISKKDIRDFVKECLKQAPDYVFEDCPSSSSGKFHPLDELAGDGTILHTKKVFAVAYDLSRALDCENHRDEICAAVILHDIVKQGIEKSGHTDKYHPQLGAKFIADVYNNSFKDKLSRESANIIYWCVFYHYGIWTTQGDRKPITKFTQEELCVHLADYITSKRFVSVDYRRSSGV